MTLGRCPLSIFCSRGAPPNPESINPIPSTLNLPHFYTKLEIRPRVFRFAYLLSIRQFLFFKICVFSLTSLCIFCSIHSNGSIVVPWVPNFPCNGALLNIGYVALFGRERERGGKRERAREKERVLLLRYMQCGNRGSSTSTVAPCHTWPLF